MCRSPSRRRRAAAARGRKANWRDVRGRLVPAHARVPIGCCLAGAGNGLEVHHRVVAEHLTLRHDVEVVAVSVLVRTSHRRAPLRVAVVRAEIRDHHNDRLPRVAALAASAAGRTPGRRQLVALAAPGTAPGGAGGVVERLRASCSIDAGFNAQLPFVSKSEISHRCGRLVGVGDPLARRTDRTYCHIRRHLHRRHSNARPRISRRLRGDGLWGDLG